MDGRCGAAVKGMASGLACSVMGQIGTAAWPQATAPPIEHVVLVDARLWQESHEEIERHMRCGAEAVYIARPCEVAIYLHGKTKEQLAAIKSINMLFHGSPYDANDQPIAKDDEALATKATSIEVLGSRLSVKANEVAEMVSITPASTPEQRQASRAKYAAYWELRDAMVLLWDATEAQKAPFYLYACNLAKIDGFKKLFTGFGRPVFGSTDVTGPPPKNNWLVEWESEGNSVSAAEAAHAETEVFVNPGGMKLELWWTLNFTWSLSGMEPKPKPKVYTRPPPPPPLYAKNAALKIYASGFKNDEDRTWNIKSSCISAVTVQSVVAADAYEPTATYTIALDEYGKLCYGASTAVFIESELKRRVVQDTTATVGWM